MVTQRQDVAARRAENRPVDCGCARIAVNTQPDTVTGVVGHVHHLARLRIGFRHFCRDHHIHVVGQHVVVLGDGVFHRVLHCSNAQVMDRPGEGKTILRALGLVERQNSRVISSFHITACADVALEVDIITGRRFIFDGLAVLIQLIHLSGSQPGEGLDHGDGGGIGGVLHREAALYAAVVKGRAGSCPTACGSRFMQGHGDLCFPIFICDLAYNDLVNVGAGYITLRGRGLLQIIGVFLQAAEIGGAVGVGGDRPAGCR